MSPLQIFLSVFGVIFVAELPDKTALAALVLATRHKPAPVFLGTALALTVQSAVAITAGGLLSKLPPKPIHIGAGLLFLISAIFMWRRKAEKADDPQGPKAHAHQPGSLRSFAITFGVVFVAEWGDLTQLATAAFAAHYRAPLLVFSAATLALWLVAALAVFAGNRAGKLLDENITKKIAAAIFALVGFALLFGSL